MSHPPDVSSQSLDLNANGDTGSTQERFAIRARANGNRAFRGCALGGAKVEVADTPCSVLRRVSALAISDDMTPSRLSRATQTPIHTSTRPLSRA